MWSKCVMPAAANCRWHQISDCFGKRVMPLASKIIALFSVINV